PVYKDLFKGLRLEYASFENKTEIGKGRFGIMYKAYSKNEKQIVKHTVKHDNVIEFFGITQDSETKTYCLVFQYANRGDLRCYLNDYFPKLDWTTKIRMAREISSGIKCLHSVNIVHRNLVRDFSSLPFL
ncbi:kinase-like domain-containing protein, partial [Gigaspora rosea]